MTGLGVPPLATAAAASAGAGVGEDPRWAAARWLARLGGQLALEGLAHAHVTWKSDDSMVTDVDVRIQERLAAEIARAFPGDLVVGEEGVPPDVAALHDHVWAIDPIDGTNNFGRGLPGFAVSVGVLAAGIPIAGAVYDPVADQLFTARVGQGAWLGDRRLTVGPAPLGPRSLISVRTPYPAGVPAAVLDWLTRYRLRRSGSTALHLCYVAMGALAFVHDHGASIWDVAGAVPVLLEAGGRFTAPDGAALFPVAAPALAGARLAFVAGDPGGHAQAVADLGGAQPHRNGGPRRDRLAAAD